MSDISLYTLLGDPQTRQAIVEELEKAAQGDNNLSILADGIKNYHYIFPLSEDQEVLLTNIIRSSDSIRRISNASLFADEPPDISTEQHHNFISRGPEDTLKEFIENNLDTFGLGRSAGRDARTQAVANFFSYTGIRLGSAKMWGQKTERGIVEPRDLNQVLKVYRWLNMRANENGKEVDFFDFIACVYPRVSKMIARSDADGQIIVRIPEFMADVSYDRIDYSAFAIAARNAGLVRGVPESTVDSHARGTVERPTWESLDRYALLLAEQTSTDNDEIDLRSQYLDFLVFLRLFPVIGHIVPTLDLADRPVTKDLEGNYIREPLNDYPTRFTLRMVPQQEVITYLSFGDALLFNVRYWPFSGMASGMFDNMLELINTRIGTFENFSGQLADENLNVSTLRNRYEDFLRQHTEFKASLEAANPDPATRTQQYLDRIRTFYRTFDKFFKEVFFYTHARGSVDIGGLSIDFEIVPQMRDFEISPISDGRVSIFAEDIIQKAAQDGWTQEQVDNVFKLRVLTSWHVASGTARKELLTDAGKIATLLEKSNGSIPEADWQDIISKFVDLNLAANEGVSIQIYPALHRAMRLRVTDTGAMQEYYLYGLSKSWQEELTDFYSAQNYSITDTAMDAIVIETYFKSVRHPHSIFNAGKLQNFISQAYSTESESGSALERILAFFRHINVRTNPEPLHTLSSDDTSPEMKVIDWAFQDYIANFPGARELGSPIELNNDLIGEIIDRIISEIKNGQTNGGGIPPLRKSHIRRGLIAAINQFNREQNSQSISQIARDFYPLPQEGIFPERFNAYIDRWGRENHVISIFGDITPIFGEAGSTPNPILDKQKLILAFGIIKDNGFSLDSTEAVLLQVGIKPEDIEDNDRLMMDWIVNLRTEMDLLTEFAVPDKVETYLNRHYQAPMISAEIVSKLTLEYLKRRLTTPQPVDLDGLIIEAIGTRFDPYPSIKNEVVAFYHFFIQDYLNHVYSQMKERYENTLQVINDTKQSFLDDLSKVLGKDGYRSFETIILRQLNFIKSEEEIQPAPGTPPGVTFAGQLHISVQELNDFEQKFRLLSEALGKPGPNGTVLGTDGHSEDKRLEEVMYSAWTEIETKFKEQMEANRLEHLKLQMQLASIERPVRKFWERTQTSLVEYLSSYDTARMDRTDAANAMRAVDEGLALIVNLKKEMDSDIFAAWGKAAEMSERIAEHDSATETFEKTEQLISSAEDHLNEQKILLQIRMEEIEAAEQREIADHNALEQINQANATIRQVAEVKKDIENISTRISVLRLEMETFTQETIPESAQSLSAYQEAWQEFEILREKADQLRKDLNVLRGNFPTARAGEIQNELADIRPETLSNAVREQRSETRRRLIEEVSPARALLEQSETLITNLGRSIAAAKRQFDSLESNISLPSTTHLSEEVEMADSHIYFPTGSPSFISFNLSEFRGISNTKLERALAALTNTSLLVMGDQSYIISGETVSRINEWLADRTSQIEISDVFGESVIIPKGFRGIYVADEKKIPKDHAIFNLRNAFRLLLSQKSHEADLVVKLFDQSRWRYSNVNIWHPLVAALAQNGPFETRDQAAYVVRRFAVTNYENIRSHNFGKNSWFVESKLPLRVELSESEAESLNAFGAERLSNSFQAIQGVSNLPLVEAATREFEEAIKPYLNGASLNWWNDNAQNIPKETGILWAAIKTAYNTATLQKLLLLSMADYIEGLHAGNGSSTQVPISECTRFALKFLMEHLIEIRFGDILYDGQKLLYDFNRHEALSEVAVERLKYPDFKTIVLLDKLTGRRLAGLMVSQAEFERIMEAQQRGETGSFTFEHFDLKTKEMTPIRANLDDILFVKPVTDMFMPMYEIIYTEPRFLALGFMIQRISNQFTYNSLTYKSMIRIMERYHFERSEQQEAKIAKLIEIEREIEILYRQSAMSAHTALNDGSTTISGYYTPRTSKEASTPLEGLDAPSYTTRSIVIEGFLDDKTPVSSGGATIAGYYDPFTGTSSNDPHYIAACRQIEEYLSQNLQYWNTLDAPSRQTIASSIANLAMCNPYEEITMSVNAISSFYQGIGRIAPANIQAFTMPNPFVRMAPMVRLMGAR